MKNNKGFSLVELLAVVAILGILTGIAIGAYSRYTEKARQQAYDTLAESSTNAATEYLMDHQGATSVNFDELAEGEYIENIADPLDNTQNCRGTVTVTTNSKAGALDENSYTVRMCCQNYNYTYTYPSKNKVENKDGCKADKNVLKLIEKDKDTNCISGKTVTKDYNIYTINYLNKVCKKDANGQYGACHDPNNPFTKEEYPCRMYEYHQRTCHCTYSTVTNKFCSSTVNATGDDHTMRINYLNNATGEANCDSNSPSSINSYVDHVCWYGRYTDNQTVMTFHGYQFFKGKSVGYTDFRPDGSWFHDGEYYDERVPRTADINGKPDYARGCEDTCINFTEEWMGKVD